MSDTYPISLVLTGRKVLIVGGGEVATRKVRELLPCDAQITIVAPTVSFELKQWAEKGLCFWKECVYDCSDLHEAVLVFACTDDEEVNARVSRDAQKQNILVNVADSPRLCSFYLPSVLRRGMLSVAVSTEGSSPLTARRIREELEEQIGDEMAPYLLLLQSWREKILLSLPAEKRLLFWQRASDGRVYRLVKSERLAEADDELKMIHNELLSE